jgi:hypothetical protein
MDTIGAPLSTVMIPEAGELVAPSLSFDVRLTA